MNVSNGIENLSQIFSTQATPAASFSKNSPNPQSEGLGSDKAQVSAVATQVVQSAGAPDVRLDKVASIQSALQAGTYSVSAADVAQKVVASMIVTEK